jgi:hypothetical protein
MRAEGMVLERSTTTSAAAPAATANAAAVLRTLPLLPVRGQALRSWSGEEACTTSSADGTPIGTFADSPVAGARFGIDCSGSHALRGSVAVCWSVDGVAFGGNVADRMALGIQSVCSGVAFSLRCRASTESQRSARSDRAGAEAWPPSAVASSPGGCASTRRSTASAAPTICERRARLRVIHQKPV